jgi:hypothetical protein
MMDFGAIRVLHFSGRKEEWPSWNEKFLAKAKRSGIKDLLLGCNMQTAKNKRKHISEV